jgi:hypothetical protein
VPPVFNAHKSNLICTFFYSACLLSTVKAYYFLVRKAFLYPQSSPFLLGFLKLRIPIINMIP